MRGGFFSLRHQHRGVAQVEERRVHTPEVAGSSPAPAMFLLSHIATTRSADILGRLAGRAFSTGRPRHDGRGTEGVGFAHRQEGPVAGMDTPVAGPLKRSLQWQEAT